MKKNKKKSRMGKVPIAEVRHQDSDGDTASPMEEIPYHEGMNCPGPDWILAQICDKDGTVVEKCWVKADQLKKGPVRNEIPPDLVGVVRWTWRHLKEHIPHCKNLEDWELGFMHDHYPECEIVTWAHMTYAYLEFSHRHPEIKGNQVYKFVLALSRGQQSLIRCKPVRRELEELCSHPPKGMSEPSNFTEDGHYKPGPRYLE